MNGSGIEVTKDLTIPKLFLSQCKRYGKDKVAMREKEFGIWIPFTWQDYYNNVKYLSLGMMGLGLKKGDKVATTGGIYGKITDVKDRTVTLEIADNVIVKVDKTAVIADPGDQPAQSKK